MKKNQIFYLVTLTLIFISLISAIGKKKPSQKLTYTVDLEGTVGELQILQDSFNKTLLFDVNFANEKEKYKCIIGPKNTLKSFEVEMSKYNHPLEWEGAKLQFKELVSYSFENYLLKFEDLLQNKNIDSLESEETYLLSSFAEYLANFKEQYPKDYENYLAKNR